jgi:hypothetical protein
MNYWALSLHIDQPKRKRIALAGKWDPVMQEITMHTASTFGATILGLHEEEISEFMFFAPLAHRRDSQGNFIMPANQEDCLYDQKGNPLPDAMHRWVKGTLVDATGRRADDHVFFTVTRDSYSRVHEWVDERKYNPERYNSIHYNCVRFALKALSVGGLELPTAGLPRTIARLRRPEDISEAIHTLGTQAKIQHFAEPILLGQAADLNFMPGLKVVETQYAL